MSYDPKAVEPAVRAFWAQNKVYEKAKKKVAGKTSFYFLDGPPYTSGKVHLGTSWNKSLKDMFLRFKRMSGFDVWDRAGYDMHGLPTENNVRKKLKLFTKKEIENYGLAKFNDECEKFCVDMMHVMNKTFTDLGIWMDFEHAYQPISREYISGEWFLIKSAHDKKRLYEGLRTMSWCPSCQTNLAKHELEYATVTDESIFVKLKVKDKSNEYLIIWTTTPWTIPMNLAVMVNPEIDYVRANVEGEVWIMAKALAGTLVSAVAEKKMSILEEFKGETLEGLEYTHPFADTIHDYKEMKVKHPKLHTVILSQEYVDTSAGSGLVHCAPGCGPEDYEVGYRNGLPAWNVVDERGSFPQSMKEFAGFIAKKDDSKFIDALKKRNAIIATTKVSHDYGHCQRCHHAIIFRTSKQWFFKVEDLKEQMIEANKNVKWVPQAAFNAFDSWLKNLRDNSITKQNFWGTPVPIWKCSQCDKHDVYGSLDELEAKTKVKVTKLHRPWIDEVTYACSCGGTKKRIPDVLDVWVDAGTASWNCLDYPQKKDLFNKMFPADFILEGKDQIRGWFNLLMIASMLCFNKPSFKAVYMHGFINDSQGRKMSKSLGNQIEPEEVVSVYGADTLRYFQTGSAAPGIDQSYNPEDVKLKYKNLVVLWNVHNFLIEMAKDAPESKAGADVPEHYILSKLNTTIQAVTRAFDEYRLNEVPWLIEELYLELSRTYIQLVRDKANSEDKGIVIATIKRVLLDTIAMLAPVAPFIAEQMYQNLKEAFNLKAESVHLLDWPKCNAKEINTKLEQQFKIAGNIMQAALYAREKIKLGVRWPVKGIVVLTVNPDVKLAIVGLGEVIKSQVNIKDIKVQEALPEVKEEVHINSANIGKAFKQHAPAVMKALQSTKLSDIAKQLRTGAYILKIGETEFRLTQDHFTFVRTMPDHLVEVPFSDGIVYLDKESNKELEAEGFMREVMRRIQEARKKAGLEKQDKIDLHLEVSDDVREMLKDWHAVIAEKVNAKMLKVDVSPPSKQHKNRSSEELKGEIFSIHFDVV